MLCSVVEYIPEKIYVLGSFSKDVSNVYDLRTGGVGVGKYGRMCDFTARNYVVGEMRDLAEDHFWNQFEVNAMDFTELVPGRRGSWGLCDLECANYVGKTADTVGAVTRREAGDLVSVFVEHHDLPWI